ncbi:hypothetical protein JCM11641_005812 [Rhodosporidiobolus odoratus]
MSRQPPTFDQYYAASPSPFSRRSSTFSPLLPSSRRVSIRTPSLTHTPSGLPGFLRGRGRWRKGAALAGLILVVGTVMWVHSSVRSGGRFAQVGGFGLDYMGRDEPQRAKRLPPIEVEGGVLKLCILFPWRSECEQERAKLRDPFEALRFKEEGGRLYYPATRAPPLPPKLGRRPSTPEDKPPDPALQPHPIHHLVRQGKREWKAKVERQSKNLKAAVQEYEERYGRRPPKGFADWYFFAKANDFVMVDEFDLVMRQIEPFLAVKPSTLVKRHEKMQFDEEFWIQDKTFTVELKQHGGVIQAHGPMKGINERTDQMLRLLGGVAKHLPDMNVTFTGHDVPWVVLSGENRDLHTRRARTGQLLSDEEAEDPKDNWEYDGWAQSCPPDSPIRRVPSFDERMKRKIYSLPTQRSFIKEHQPGMDLCSHPESQLIHGFTAWPGPRSGLLYPLFTSTTTSMHSDLLIPPIDQYDRPQGNDPAWENKKYNMAVWRGTTTGADLNLEHMRKWSQRPRLCRLPFESGTLSLPYAPEDNATSLAPVGIINARSQALAQKYFDFKFLGTAKQCDDPEVCAAFAKDFLWDEWMPEDEQNEYKYMVDIDGNGWSGRFHRLISTNSLVLKQTIFPEWYSDMIQPWVHYVPISTDFSDLWTAMAFFIGDENAKGGHDEIAKEIAMQGKKWAETHWRYVDIEVYMYRLLLEYARVIGRDDHNLHSMDM